ncbi:HDOD domain-containing protein [Xylophilus sp.]|uniref:HDOD domain-containing protein n=1 Tax=Xylophilus sp. TaxID=2653893 RepID=UPI0013BCFB85|nr:HDOD domain-containing protein [Xylophilus sp.]KAF1044621.1 MAG: Cyclic di-GMP phosphodiesterase CdgJ [Xylophilus sp.]
MVQSVLGSLTLGYRPLWNRNRALAGVQLFVCNDGEAPVDAPHLLRTLHETWGPSSPQLLLSLQTHQLLHDLLAHAAGGEGQPWIEVPGEWLDTDPGLRARVQAAHARGAALVWRGGADRLPDAPSAGFFRRSLVTLPPEYAVTALQAESAGMHDQSPVQPGWICEGIENRALLDHALDRRQAWGTAGWPAEDVLHTLRHDQPQPLHSTLLRLLKVIDADESLESFEQILSEDPLLAYRFMVFTNSAALGLRTGIDSLRRGLMMMGYGALARWLTDQLPSATTEPDVLPIRGAMVIRARLTEQLIDAGIEADLRREVYLCGLFSQLDGILREPLGTILKRLPLSERIYAATVTRTGPYAPSLDVACALETGDAAAVRQLRKTHDLGAEEVNRVLLRVLRDLDAARP